MSDQRGKYGEAAFFCSLAGLAALPLLPEISIYFLNGSDLKHLIPLLYYECIISFLLFAPALLLPRLAGRVWVAALTAVLTPVTVIVGFYATVNGARWNMTAHTALMQTNSSEAWGYLETFVTWGRTAWAVFLVVAFAGCLAVNLRSTPPPRPRAAALILLGLIVSAYGLRNTWVYGRKIVRDVSVEGSTTPLSIAGMSINMVHPLTLFLATHYNFLSTHHYYLQQYARAKSHAAELAGARPVPGATPPRLLVVVIGESATRRHWSLYGYHRPTTPELDRIHSELLVFTDVISNGVGTLASIRGMLTLRGDAAPAFGLFTGAGYRTHWLSTKFSEGFDDLELGTLTDVCNEHIFLSGSYDMNLLPLLDRAAAEPGRQLIFLNLMGSHVRYSDRYPENEDVFHGDTDAEKLKATYDNSIHYTDHFLGQLIDNLRRRHEASCLLYFSDHGEDVYDSRPDRYLFRDDSIATDPMYEVPFVLWFSPEYIKANPEYVRQAAEAVNHPYKNIALYQGLLSLARLTHPLYDPAADVFSPAFVPPVRRVGVAGRIYEKRD